MAFEASELRLIRDLGRVNYWHYLTSDPAASVDSAGYFNAAAGRLKVGDVILRVSVDDIGAPATINAAGHHLVVANDGSTVDVSDATALSLTDTD